MPANTPNDTDASDTGSSASTLAWGTSSFEPGPDVGLVSRHTVGLIERDNPSTRDRLWQLVADDAPLDDILDELSSTGLKALPDFGIAQVEGDAVRVVAHGRTTITAELVSGDQHEIDPSGVRTWIEEVVTDVVGVTIALSPLDDDDAPLSAEGFAVLAGSVPARSVTRRFDVADSHADDAIAGWSATSIGTAPGLDVAEDVELEMFASTEDAEGSEEDDSLLAGNAGALAAEVPAHPGAPDDVEPADPPPADPRPASPRPSVPAPADPRPASPQPSGPPPADPQPASPQPSGPPVSSIFDDEVVGEPVTPTLPPDDRTRAPGAVGDAAAPEAPQIHGVLAFSNGERIGVDRSVLIGRNPKVAGDVEGGLPHIMKFDGPGQGLSRTHAEVRVENGEMLLEDLQSTNGTEIQLPGQQRRRLRGGEPVVVVPGTLIDFGDELHCTVETAG